MERETRPHLWRSPDERDGRAAADPDLNAGILHELVEVPLEGMSPTRRSFLRLAGFGLAAAGASCTRGPVEKAIPYLNPPETIVPGKAYWMATTCGGCAAGCGVLAKARDGRPVKLEGLPDHPVSGGGLCAVGQASLLSLYDSQRLDGPQRGGEATTWSAADASVREQLDRIRAEGGAVRLLTGTVTSPSTRAAIKQFLASVPGSRHVAYDALSASAVLDAHAETHGLRVLPRLRFDLAQVIVSFDADFLGTWISPVEFAAAWRRGRDLEAEPPRMSRHVQLESRLSLTGTRADRRVRLAPWETVPALAALVAALAELRGAPAPAAAQGATPEVRALVEELADELWKHRGESLIVCGENDPAAQRLVNLANEWLENYGSTLDLERPSLQRQGDDRALEALRAELEAGSVDLLIVAGCNPAYDLAGAGGFSSALEGPGFVVACTALEDETTALADLTLPVPHPLESWDDAEPVSGVLGLRQPTVPPLRSARTLRATLARWLGDEREDRELLREHWRTQVLPRQSGSADFERFFTGALQSGFVELEAASQAVPGFQGAAALPRGPVPAGPAPAAGELALVLYPKVAMLDGSHAHNPWLQELPDPVTKVVWDNYACLSQSAAAALSVREGDLVRVSDPQTGASLELPAFVQPGQHDGVVAVALGYGRAGTGRFAKVGPQWLQGRDTVAPGGVVGRNAAPLLRDGAGALRASGASVRVERTSGREPLACTQEHHSLQVPAHLAPAGHGERNAVLATTFAAWQADPAEAVHHGSHPHGELWAADHEREGPQWGMVVDLAACTGCSACVIGCQAENNVPVVGKDEVRRHREMHWIRLDRYYEGEGDDVQAHHQPMMCQHCDHAPCETVCPVLATVQSREGLNQQVYNRCVGTRYCANNCPYKVRRFNWFDYPHEDRLQNMALNPDVTVRSRGVMEKCSMCAQRILEARIEARRQGLPVADGDIRTACEQSCPTSAIVFGDLGDAESRAAQLAASPRAYGVLEELNVQPSVRYLAQVRNTDAGATEESHG